MRYSPVEPAGGDRDLLRRFEPVLRYTAGEEFFPMEVEPYVRSCSLWRQRTGEEPVCVVPEGKLTLERLADRRAASFDTVYFLKFAEPLNVRQLAAYKLRRRRERRGPKREFRSGVGRLARVGYVSRFMDTLFSLTLLARGRVSGDTAAAASQTVGQTLAGEIRHCYYGRVLRRDGWISLQYWFFYPFNNWRSGFFGVNDHEADWEMVCLYLSGAEGAETPEWVAYSSHDFSGDDLRRRWDDPEVEKVGEHPVVYTAAGSHASYYAPGEYLAEIELPFLQPLVRLSDGLRRRWRRLLRQPQSREPSRFNIFRIPFVDYARGDGRSIGPGGERSWDAAHLLEPVPAWAAGYRGLWGLYARDPVSGEDAPAGPLYNRDGTMRRAWYDPMGWAGLDKVPPRDEAAGWAQERHAELESRCAALSAEISTKSRELAGLGIEAEAMQGRPHLKGEHTAQEERISTASRELAALRARLASEEALLEALDDHEDRLRDGDRGPLRSHIRRAHEPGSPENLRLDKLAELWAALSIGLAIVVVVALILFAREYLGFGLAALVSLLIFVESGFRRRLGGLVTSVTVGLALVAALVLLFEFFWPIVILAVLAAGIYVVWENLRELWV